MPGSSRSQKAFWKGRSVAFCCVTRNCSGVSRAIASLSLLYVGIDDPSDPVLYSGPRLSAKLKLLTDSACHWMTVTGRESHRLPRSAAQERLEAIGETPVSISCERVTYL